MRLLLSHEGRGGAHALDPDLLAVLQEQEAEIVTRSSKRDDIRAFLAEDSTFEIDRRPEYFVYSQHSGGFLRKKL